MSHDVSALIAAELWKTDVKLFVAKVRSAGDWVDDALDERFFYPLVRANPAIADVFEMRHRSLRRAMTHAPPDVAALLAPFCPPQSTEHLRQFIRRMHAAPECHRLLVQAAIAFHDRTEDIGPFWWAGRGDDYDPWDVRASQQAVSAAFVRFNRDPRDAAPPPAGDMDPAVAALLAASLGRWAIHMLAAAEWLTLFAASLLTAGFETLEHASRAQRIAILQQRWMQPPREEDGAGPPAAAAAAAAAAAEARRSDLVLRLLSPTAQEAIEVRGTCARDAAAGGLYIFGCHRIFDARAFLPRMDVRNTAHAVMVVSNCSGAACCGWALRDPSALERAEPVAVAAIFHHILTSSMSRESKAAAVSAAVAATRGGPACEPIVLACIFAQHALDRGSLETIEMHLVQERMGRAAVAEAGAARAAGPCARGFVCERNAVSQCAAADALFAGDAAAAAAAAAHVVRACEPGELGELAAWLVAGRSPLREALWDELPPARLPPAACGALWGHPDATPLFRLRCVQLHPHWNTPDVSMWIVDECTSADVELLSLLVRLLDERNLLLLAERKPELFTGPVQREAFLLLQQGVAMPAYAAVLDRAQGQSAGPAGAAIQKMLSRSGREHAFTRHQKEWTWDLFDGDPASLCMTMLVPHIRDFVVFGPSAAVDPSFDAQAWKDEWTSALFGGWSE
jgi:hypothetical protein